MWPADFDTTAHAGTPPRVARRVASGLLALAPIGLAVAVALLAGPRQAQAVPSFAQQTGQPCSACHVGAFGPQLKPYARDFKLFGYQATDNKSHELPIAVTLLGSYTQTEAPQTPAAAPHFAANDNLALDQVSAYYAGRAPGGFGAFAQATYDGVGETLLLDNVDLRNARALDIRGKDLVLGVDFNNNPTMEDAWNSTPAWGYPYNASPLGPVPAAATLIDGGLAHQVVSGGAYLYWDYSVYAEVSAYKQLDRVFAGRLGAGTNSQSDRFDGIIPYWRVALNHDFSPDASAEIGTYGLSAERFPGGVVSAGRDRITDWAIDATAFNQMIKNQTLSAHATWIHEDEDLTASSALLGANPHDRLDTVRGDVSWSIADTLTPTVQVFRTTGTADAALYPGSGGRPDSAGYVLELAYTGWGKPKSPVYWFNWRTALQYVGYTRFNGAGQGASANNTLYLNFWVAMAPLGSRVVR